MGQGVGVLINGAREWGMEDGLKSPGEASFGTGEKHLYVYGRKELRMDKDIQRWAEEVSSKKVLQTL